MKQRKLLALAAALGFTSLVVWAAVQQAGIEVLQADTPAAAPQSLNNNAAAAGATVNKADTAAAESTAPAFPDLDNSELEAWLPRLNSDAVQSMANARVHGDPRAPAVHASKPREMPTAAELADEDLYLQYEQRQEKRMYRAFVEASKGKVALIQSYIDKAGAGGISDEEVAFAKEKIRRIQAMAEKLQQDNPDIMGDEFRPQDNWLPAAE